MSMAFLQSCEFNIDTSNVELCYAELVLCGDLEGYFRRVSGPHSGVEGNS